MGVEVEEAGERPAFSLWSPGELLSDAGAEQWECGGGGLSWEDGGMSCGDGGNNRPCGQLVGQEGCGP